MIPSTRQTTVKLHGELAAIYGSEYKVVADTVEQALSALYFQLPGFSDVLAQDGKRWRVVRGGKTPDEGTALPIEALGMRVGRAKTVHVAPEPVAGGIETILIIGVGLAVAVAAAALFVRPVLPSTAMDREKDQIISTGFNGPVNVEEQGWPYPLPYGEYEVGSIVASSSYTVEDIVYQDAEDDGGFLGGLPGIGIGNPRGIDFFATGGGKGGGGSQRTAQEDPNTLQSNAIARFIDIVGNGPALGLVVPGYEGLKGVKIDGTFVRNSDGTDNFKGIMVRERLGLPDQDYIPGFDFQETPRAVGKPVTVALGRQTETVSDSDVDKVRVIVRLPNGLYRQDKENGDLKVNKVKFAIDLQLDGGGWNQVLEYEVSGKQTSMYEKQFVIDLPPGGVPWDIGVRRVTADAAGIEIIDDIEFFYLGEITEAKLTYPNRILYACEVDAKQFGDRIATRSYFGRWRTVDVPTNYDPTTRVYATSGPGTTMGIWDGTFKKAWTNNSLWVWRDALVDKRSGLGNYIDVSRLNEYALYRIAQNCDRMVPDGKGGEEPLHTFNGVLSIKKPAYQWLTEIAASFRSMIYGSTGVVTLVQDAAPLGTPKLIDPTTLLGEDEFTDVGISNESQYTGYVVWWNDPAAGFRLQPIVVEDPDLTRALGFSRLKEVEMLGCTSPGQAQRYGLMLLEDQKAKYVTWRASHYQSDIQPGDIVSAQDPKYTVDQWYGRCNATTLNTLTLDREITMVGGVDYFIRVMLPNGESEEKQITTGAGTVSAVTLASNLSMMPVAKAVWSIRSSVLAPRLLRIVSREGDGDDDEYSFKARWYDPTKHDRVENKVHVEATPFTALPSGPLQAPDEPVVEEFFKTVGNANVPSAIISWPPTNDPRIATYEVQYKEPGGETYLDLGDDRSTSREITNVEPGDYVFRLRSRNSLGQKSGWRVLEVTLLGEGVSVPNVTVLTKTTDDASQTISLSWSEPLDARPLDYQILYGAPGSALVDAVVIGTTKLNKFIVYSLGKYWVRSSYMSTVASGPPTITVEAADQPHTDWTAVDGRPTNLNDLDPASYSTLSTAAAEVITNAANIAQEIIDRAAADGAIDTRVTSMEVNGDKALNGNPVYRRWTNASNPPDGWISVGTVTRTRLAGLTELSLYSNREVSMGGVNCAHRYDITINPGWYVVEADIVFNSGSLSGAGVYIDGFGTPIIFRSTPDINNNVLGYTPTTGRRYRWRVLYQHTDATTARYILGCTAHSIFGETIGTSRSITWENLRIRPAEAGEVENGVARAGFTSLSARFTDVIMTAATSTGAVSTRVTALETSVAAPNALPDRVSVRENWTNVSPTTVPTGTTASTAGTIVAVQNEGDVIELTGSTQVWWTRSWLPLIAGHTYRYICRNCVTVDGTANVARVGYSVYNQSAGNLANVIVAQPSRTVANGWVEDTFEFTTAAAIAASTAAATWVRPFIRASTNTGATYSGATSQIAFCRLEDITDIRVLSASVTAATAAAVAGDTAVATTVTTLKASFGKTALPKTFADSTLFTSDGSSNVLTAVPPDPTIGTFPTVSGIGQLWRSRSGATDDGILHKGFLPLIAGHSYFYRTKLRAIADATNGNALYTLIQFYCYDSTGTVTPSGWVNLSGSFNTYTVAGGWVEYSGTLTTAAIQATHAAACYIRFIVLKWSPSSPSDGQMEVQTMELRDVTEEVAIQSQVTVTAGAVTTLQGQMNAFYNVDVSTSASKAGFMISAGNVSYFDIYADRFRVWDGAAKVEVLEVSGGVVKMKKAHIPELSAGEVTAAKISVSSLSAITATIGTLRTATTGARMEIIDNALKVFDSSNVKRVQLGDLSL